MRDTQYSAEKLQGMTSKILNTTVANKRLNVLDALGISERHTMISV